MRRHHFELLKPLCPVCLAAGLESHPLRLARVDCETSDKIWEGKLQCTQATCNSEFPIIDGLPILLPNLRAYVADQIFQIMSRDDLSGESLSLLGDCCSQNSHLDVTRQHLSCYGWDHYAEFDPKEEQGSGSVQPGSIVQAMRTGLTVDEVGTLPDGPLLDAGCSVGRTAFELAERSTRDVLGIDVNYAMLRMASTILRDGQVRYGKRRCGLVYEPRQYPVHFQRAQRVDFWICDALALPFAPQSFAAAIGMNLLDSVPSPEQLVHSLRRALKPSGQLLLASPYDWSAAVTPVEAWIGGHSQRAPDRGASEPLSRYLLEHSGFDVLKEWPDIEWNVRMHDRSSMAYRLHMILARC